MSQRVDQRVPRHVSLDAYQFVLKLTAYSDGVCKPKRKKNKNGVECESNRHLAIRDAEKGKEIMRLLILSGGIILDANKIYVAPNLNRESRIENFRRRIKLQSEVIGYLYRIEHIIRVIEELRPFHDDVFDYWVGMLINARSSVIEWKESDVDALRRVEVVRWSRSANANNSNNGREVSPTGANDNNNVNNGNRFAPDCI